MRSGSKSAEQFCIAAQLNKTCLQLRTVCISRQIEMRSTKANTLRAYDYTARGNSMRNGMHMVHNDASMTS